MKKVVLYGNCQIANIARLLKGLYKKELDIFNMTQVQKINHLEYFDKVISHIKNADWIIMQNINIVEKDPFVKILPYIQPNTKVIFIDSLFCSFYNPELIKLNTFPSFQIGMLHDINVLKAFIEKVSLVDFLNSDPFHNIDFYDTEHYKKAFENTINELNSRQKLLKIKINGNNFQHISITSYINNSYENSEIALWADFNHPKLPVYKYLLKIIVEKIGLTCKVELLDQQYDVYSFQNINRPSYASTIKYFNLNSEFKSTVYNLGKSYQNKTREEYVKDVYDFYSLVSDETLAIAYQQIKRYKKF